MVTFISARMQESRGVSEWLVHRTNNTKIPDSIPAPGSKFQGLNFRLSICVYGLEEMVIVSRKGTIKMPTHVKREQITSWKRHPYRFLAC